MIQNAVQKMESYTENDLKVWQLLVNEQMQNIKGKAVITYLDCLQKMNPVLNNLEIPDFGKINRWFKNHTGWEIERVPGLIPVEDFFTLLAQKKFCSSTWLRSYENLHYLEEPDMFHDIFGHVPLLSDPVFSAYVHNFGKLGVRHINDKEKLLQLQRLYWFTIEFGVIKENGRLKPYGAGILSSIGETNKVHQEKGVFHSFDIQKIIHQDFHTDKMQEEYFVISSFKELFTSLKMLE